MDTTLHKQGQSGGIQSVFTAWRWIGGRINLINNLHAHKHNIAEYKLERASYCNDRWEHTRFAAKLTRRVTVPVIAVENMYSNKQTHCLKETCVFVVVVLGLCGCKNLLHVIWINNMQYRANNETENSSRLVTELKGWPVAEDKSRFEFTACAVSTAGKPLNVFFSFCYSNPLLFSCFSTISNL